MYIHLAISEAIGEEQIRDAVRIMREYGPALADDPDFVSFHVDIEDGGRMILFTTVWRTREACIRYHSSRLYRQLVKTTQHLFLGNFVVKVLRREEGQ